jgi:autotransporter translocation and assembly factor TamB
MAGRHRWWRRSLLGLAGLVGVPVGLLLALVWSPVVSRLVIIEALTHWDASNPARLDWRALEGSLGAGLRVEDLALIDAEGRPLILVDQLELELGFWALVRGTVTVDRLALRGVDVWSDHAWADLANPEAPVEPPEPGYGPDVPVELRATITVADARVWIDELGRVELGHLRLHAWAHGREAAAELSAAQLRLPRQKLELGTLALAARWDSPHAHIDRLQLESPLVAVEQLRGSYDVAMEVGTLALDAEVSLDALAEQFGLELDRFGKHARVSARARGGPRTLGLALALDLGAAGEIDVHAAGVPTGPTGQRWASARVRGRVGAGVLASEEQQGPMRFELLATVGEHAQQPGFVAALVGGIHDFRSGERLSLISEATMSSLDPLDGRATVELRGAGLELEASLERDAVTVRGGLLLRVAELQRPLGLAAGLLAQPTLGEVRGRLAVEGRCHGPADSLESLFCRSKLRLTDTAVGDTRLLDDLTVEAHGTLARVRVQAAGHGPHEQLRLAGAVAIGERINVDLEELELHSDRGELPTRVELRRATRIGITSAAIDIDALSLSAVGGRIDVDGRLGLAESVASDLHVELAKLDLARIDPLLPGPSLAGQLSLRATLTGTLPEPNASASARGHALRIAGWRVGDVELAAAYGDHAGAGLRVSARARGPIADRFSLTAFIPLRLAGNVRLVPNREWTGHLVVEGFDLLELGGLMPDTPDWWRQQSPEAAAPPGDPKLIPEGLVDLELSLAGTPKHPRVDATLRARRLRIDRTSLGSLFARGSLDGAGARLWLVAKPSFAQIELRARVPAIVDLVRGEFEWMADDDQHLVSLDVRSLDLARLRATLGVKLPALAQALEQAQLDGIVSLSLRGAGSLGSPRLAAALRAGTLRHRGQTLGRVQLLASYAPGEAQLDLQLDGPFVGRLHGRARAPLWLPHAEQDLRVDLGREVSAELHVDALSLAALARYVGPLPIAGSVSGTLELTGSLGDPKLGLRARVDDLATAGEPLGDLSVRAGFERGRVRADAELLRAGAQIITAAAELPLIVDLQPALTGSDLRWNHAGQHRVQATGRGIDDPFLAALLGRPLATSGSSLANLEFELAGTGDVDAFRVTGTLAGQLAVDDEIALALELGLELDQASQRVDLAITPNRGAGLVGALELAGSVPALVAGDQQVAEVPFDVHLTAPDFDLRWLAALLPQSVVDPRGALRADVRGGGRLGAPRLVGSLKLADAGITVIPLRQRLADLDLELEFDERRIDLHRISLAAGRGGAKGRGRVTLGGNGALAGTLDLELNAFPLIRPGLPAMIVDAGVQLELERRGLTTNMVVVLHEPAVTVAGMNESLPQPIPSSPDVVVLGDGPAPESVEPESTAAAEHFTLRVELREPLLISGTSIDMAWAGALELDIEGGEVEVGGQVEARRGRLRLFGSSFELRRGVVTLPDDGTLDPYIDLEAVSSQPEAEVTVTVRGRLSRPTLEFSSNPALSDYQILTLLVTGSTEIGESDRDVAAKAASLLAAVSNPQLQNQLNQRLGLDRVAIGFGETIDQPILTVGKRIGRDVYVETQYHHNAPEDQNTTQLAIEYGFVPRWSLEGFFGDAAVGGVGIFWSRSFPDLQIEH